MSGSIRKFIADRSGAFAIQFALMVVPLMVCTGLAVDGGRVFLARYELAQALDAAALAVGSTANGNQTSLASLATTYVNANYRTKHNGPIKVTLGDNAAGIVVNLKGEVTVDTYFMPLVGQDKVLVKAESTIRRGGNSIEVALALDITGSMNEYPDADKSQLKIDALKVAAKDLIDTVVALPANQPPNVQYYSRLAIVPWSNNVFVGATLAPTLRGDVTAPLTDIPGAKWKKNTKTISAATWRKDGTPEFSVSQITRIGSSGNYQVQVTVSDSDTSSLVNGDIIGLYVKGTNSFSNLNGGRYKVADKSGGTFNLKVYNSSSYATAPSGKKSSIVNATEGKSHECATSECLVRVTINNHGYSAGDYLYVTAAGVPFDEMVNTTIGSPWKIASSPSVDTNTFYLEGTNGPSYTADDGDTDQLKTAITGTVNQCFTSTCSIQVTLPGHGLGDKAYIRITGAKPTEWGDQMNSPGASMTGTSTTWKIEQTDGDTFVLTGTKGGMASDYTANSGKQTCFDDGCQWQQYKNMSGTWRLAQIDNCVTERVGSDATSDAGPAANKFLGRHYDGSGNAACATTDPVMGLDDDPSELKTKIDTLKTHGVTAGHIGIAWGSYMVSPNWRNVFPVSQSEFQPAIASQSNLTRIVVFMSDGEFNAAHCGGVLAHDFGPSNENDDRSATCDSGKSAFDQAEAICDSLRDKDVRVYTVGFDVPANSEAWTFMQYCATEKKMAYLASTNAQLKTAFQEIAADISRLRIAK
jgi:Flp pilus assembly protein TadG